MNNTIRNAGPNLNPKAPSATLEQSRIQIAIRRSEALLTGRMQRLCLYGRAITPAFKS